MKHLEDFEKVMSRLEEVLALEKSAIHRDSAIKRFELCFELCWKQIKIYARHQGIECNSPRSCFKTAFQLGLIDYDETWLKMIDDRNLTAHIYKEDYAEGVYLRLPNYIGLFKELLLHLKEEE